MIGLSFSRSSTFLKILYLRKANDSSANLPIRSLKDGSLPAQAQRPRLPPFATPCCASPDHPSPSDPSIDELTLQGPNHLNHSLLSLQILLLFPFKMTGSLHRPQVPEDCRLAPVDRASMIPVSSMVSRTTSSTTTVVPGPGACRGTSPCEKPMLDCGRRLRRLWEESWCWPERQFR
jgi:hypothetical protein